MSDSFFDLSNAYTDSPNLSANPIVGSLQLLGWLFFHPSAWHNHLAGIDPNLPPNFSLAELSHRQWHQPNFRRLLSLAYGVLPCLGSLVAGLLLWGLDVPLHIIILGMGLSIILGIGAGVIGSLVVGTAVSLAFGVAVSIAGGVGVGLGLIIGVGIGRTVGNVVDVTMEAVFFGLGAGVFFGISNNLIGGPEFGHRSPASRPLTQQIGGIIIGLLLGSAVLFLGGYALITGAIPVMWLNVTATLLVGISLIWGRNRITGIIVMSVTGLALYLGQIIPGNALDIVLFVALSIPPYILTERMIGSLPGIMSIAIGSVGGWSASTIIANQLPFWSLFPWSLLSILVGSTIFWWRPILLYPILAVWHTLLRYADERRQDSQRPSFLRWHAAFWDEHQFLPWLGLEEHVLLVLDRQPTEGQAALDYLTTRRQRWAARAVQIELDARLLEGCTDIEAISQVYRQISAGDLVGPASALLRSFSRISQDVLAACQQSSRYNQRLTLSAIEDRLDALLRELTRSSERYAVRFRPIATQWRQLVADHGHNLARAVELHQEIDNPYVIGVPLTEQQEIFVGRTDVSARIEQLLLDRRRPPLLLHGQRRMGKTSLLHNLGRLLPSTIVPLFVDLQGPASQASNHAGFFYNIARGMSHSARRQRDLTLPPLTRERLATDPFTEFDEWLDEVEQTLGSQTALITFDEFEALQRAVVKGHLDSEGLLNTLRHVIQHRPTFKILLTSSQSLEAFNRWAGYLINIQVVPLSYLQEAETRQLIERPVQGFELQYEPTASCRLLELSRGHPFLVQLLCGEIIAYKNEQPPNERRLVHLADVEAVIPEALQRGSFFFTDIEVNQIDAAGVTLLKFLAGQGEGAVNSREFLGRQVEAAIPVERSLKLLHQRDLIETVEGGYRFQVELIRRWFARDEAGVRVR